MSNVEEDIRLKEISERFNNGTETLEDIINYCRNYEIKFENGLELRVVEKRYFDKLVERIKELEAKLEFKKWGDLDNIQFEEYMKNFISKQKVKDKIDELKSERDKTYEEFIKSNRANKNLHVQGVYLEAQIIILQELLEDK